MSRAFPRGLAACLVGSYLVVAALAGAQEVRVGTQAPEFQCRDDQGKLWDSRQHVGKKYVVVYFYPGDFAFCCTRQAERYRDRLCELEAMGAEVVGISGDSVTSHAKFTADHQLNFPLLSDFNGNVARTFGVPLRHGGKGRDITAARWTFVIDRNGQVIYCEPDVNPIGDTQQVLTFLCQHSARPTLVAAPEKP